MIMQYANPPQCEHVCVAFVREHHTHTHMWRMMGRSLLYDVIMSACVLVRVSSCAPFGRGTRWRDIDRCSHMGRMRPNDIPNGRPCVRARVLCMLLTASPPTAATHAIAAATSATTTTSTTITTIIKSTQMTRAKQTVAAAAVTAAAAAAANARAQSTGTLQHTHTYTLTHSAQSTIIALVRETVERVPKHPTHQMYAIKLIIKRNRMQPRRMLQLAYIGYFGILS